MHVPPLYALSGNRPDTTRPVAHVFPEAAGHRCVDLGHGGERLACAFQQPGQGRYPAVGDAAGDYLGEFGQVGVDV